MLVGELVMDVRETMTDRPQTLGAPTASFSVVSATGSTLPAGTYFVVVTQRNPFGETLGSAESTGQVVGANQGIQVTSTLLPGATTIRAYLTLANGSAGSEQQFVESSVSPFTISVPPTVSGSPPGRSSAYLPDTDGDAVSATSIFRWINRGLELASQVAGGILDFSGIGTTASVPQYIAPGLWKKISSLWYDGYPLAADDSGNYFRRNPITASVLASVSVATMNNQMMLEFWPQPSRTAASATLANALGQNDTQAVLTSTAGFLLTNGFVQIGQEIMSYSQFNATTLFNLRRALSGTVASSAPIGTAAQELNAFWQGWRMFAPTYFPGQSNIVIPIPVAWNSLMFKYALGRMKAAEQNIADHEKLEQAFMKDISDWLRTNKVNVGPRQVGEQTNTLEVWPSFGGGFVIP